MTSERELLGDAVNAAATAAHAAVLEHAARFERREAYHPLEELAGRVQRAAVAAAVEVVRNAEGKEEK
jgi:hypothetical protein